MLDWKVCIYILVEFGRGQAVAQLVEFGRGQAVAQLVEFGRGQAMAQLVEFGRGQAVAQLVEFGRGQAVAQLVEATSRKVAVSIPWYITEISNWLNPSGRTLALGWIQPLTETNTRGVSWGAKMAGVYSWQPYHLHVSIVLISDSFNLLEPSGLVQPCTGIAAHKAGHADLWLVPFMKTCTSHVPKYSNKSIN